MEELERIDKMGMFIFTFLLSSMVFFSVEYAVDEENSVNPRVLQEKRKKLCETYRRVMVMYLKEKPDYGRELRKYFIYIKMKDMIILSLCRQLEAYENHRKAMEEHVGMLKKLAVKNVALMCYCFLAAVRFSRDVNPAEIPLPDMAPPPQHFMSKISIR